MIWKSPMKRTPGVRAMFVVLTVAMLVIAGCATADEPVNTGVSAAETTTVSTNALPTSSNGEMASATLSPGQISLAAASPSADRAASLTGTDATTPTSGTSPESDALAADDTNDAEYMFTDTALAGSGGGGGSNRVQVINKKDGKLRLKADLQLNRIPGPRVEPTNLAVAYASCADCQTIAIALQINLISRGASYVAPENLAVAVNYECTNCYTVARAIQYTYSVDDPTQVPPEVNEILKELDTELKAIRQATALSIDEIEQRIEAVIARFTDLAESLNDDRDETMEATTPGATPIGDDGTPAPEESPTPEATSQTIDTPPADETPGTDAPTPEGSPAVEPSETTGTPTPTLTVTTIP